MESGSPITHDAPSLPDERGDRLELTRRTSDLNGPQRHREAARVVGDGDADPDVAEIQSQHATGRVGARHQRPVEQLAHARGIPPSASGTSAASLPPAFARMSFRLRRRRSSGRRTPGAAGAVTPALDGRRGRGRDEHRLAVRAAADDDGGRPGAESIAHLLREVAETARVLAWHLRNDERDAVDVVRAVDQRRDQRVAVSGAERPEFVPEPLVLLEDLPGSFDRALRILRLERLDEIRAGGRARR